MPVAALVWSRLVFGFDGGSTQCPCAPFSLPLIPKNQLTRPRHPKLLLVPVRSSGVQRCTTLPGGFPATETVPYLRHWISALASVTEMQLPCAGVAVGI